MSTTPSGLVSPDTSSGSPPAPEASTPHPHPPPPPPASPPDTIPIIYHHLCSSLHYPCLGTCHCSFNENVPVHCRGTKMRAWVTYHPFTSPEDFLMWELDTLQYDAITVCYPSRDPTQPTSLVSLKPNCIRHLIMLWKYIHHLVQDSHLFVSSDATDHALELDIFLHTTFHQFMSWQLNEITTSSPSPQPSVTASDTRAAPTNPSCSSQLLNFKRGIKRDISAYSTLKDETYYVSFKRSVIVTARAHDCEEILQLTFRLRGDSDSLDLFRLKNDFMYIVFNKCLLSDMGETIVRKHLDNMNAQRVWEEFATHMNTSYKARLNSVDYTPMSPPQTRTDFGNAPLSSSFSTSMNSPDIRMKSLPLRNLYPILLDCPFSKLLSSTSLNIRW